MDKDDNEEKTSALVPSPASTQEEKKKQMSRPTVRLRKLKNVAEILGALDGSSFKQSERCKNESDSDSLKENESETENDTDTDDDESGTEDSKTTSPSPSPSDGFRRSGRKRKLSEKCVNNKRRKWSKFVDSSGSESEEIDDDADANYTEKSSYRRKQIGKFDIDKKTHQKKTRTKMKVLSLDESDESDYEGDCARKYKNQKQQRRSSSSSFNYGGNKGKRTRNTTKYKEESVSHSSDNASDFEPVEEEDDTDTEWIDVILDHRRGKVGATGDLTMFWSVREQGDPNFDLETNEMEDQYHIKWKGRSHINNTWESQQTLNAKKRGDEEVKGIRKLVNYQLKSNDYDKWKRSASPEDVEYEAIDIEMGRQLLRSHTEIERIFSERKTNTNEYYVKWKNLPYEEATWEDESMILSNYKPELDQYTARIRMENEPRDYKKCMKFFKKSYKPMKEQPKFIGSSELQLRDYQMDGLNFQLKAWHKGDSLILADEMGLGKTIQSISFLNYLFHTYQFKARIANH